MCCQSFEALEALGIQECVLRVEVDVYLCFLAFSILPQSRRGCRLSTYASVYGHGLEAPSQQRTLPSTSADRCWPNCLALWTRCRLRASGAPRIQSKINSKILWKDFTADLGSVAIISDSCGDSFRVSGLTLAEQHLLRRVKFIPTLFPLLPSGQRGSSATVQMGARKNACSD